MSKLAVLDLFSGIGGWSLGLERTGGFRTAAFCEIDPYCRRVLAKHWPEIPCYDDVRTLDRARLDADRIRVDVIAAGFPCQDISLAGSGAGIEGSRSGLWREIARLAGELRPRYVLLENVAALLGRGMGRVLGDMAAIGYDCCWNCIPASALGAPHRRDRIWIVAYPDRDHGGSGRPGRPDPGSARQHEPERAFRDVPDADDAGRAQQRRPLASLAELVAAERRRGWSPEPDVCRVAVGVPNRVDRLRALGNSLVPAIPELIGRALLEQEGAA
jgi:DNA (cytosine-5)-methyltransferase 1